MFLEGEPGRCPKAALLFPDCSSLISASLPWLTIVWICPLELREGLGGWMKPISYKQERGTKKGLVPRSPTGSCSVSIASLQDRPQWTLKSDSCPTPHPPRTPQLTWVVRIWAWYPEVTRFLTLESSQTFYTTAVFLNPEPHVAWKDILCFLISVNGTHWFPPGTRTFCIFLIPFNHIF